MLRGMLRSNGRVVPGGVMLGRRQNPTHLGWLVLQVPGPSSTLPPAGGGPLDGLAPAPLSSADPQHRLLTSGALLRCGGGAQPG